MKIKSYPKFDLYSNSISNISNIYAKNSKKYAKKMPKNFKTCE